MVVGSGAWFGPFSLLSALGSNIESSRRKKMNATVGSRLPMGDSPPGRLVYVGLHLLRDRGLKNWNLSRRLQLMEADAIAVRICDHEAAAIRILSQRLDKRSACFAQCFGG